MTSAQARKGAKAEREAARLIADMTGWQVVRRRNLGTHEDVGDILGVEETTVQVKDYKDITRSIREALNDLPKQQAAAGTALGVAFIRRPGGRWIVVMEPETWAHYARETAT